MRILIAEDELVSRLLLQSLLRRYGECHVVVNGEEAVEAFRMALAKAEPYDLICMDIQMPGMCGVEAIREIRALEEKDGVLSCYGVKILMITIVDDTKEIVASFRALCDGYFVKPIQSVRLFDELRKLKLIK